VVRKLKIMAVNSGFFLYQVCTWKWLKTKFLMLEYINYNCTNWFIWWWNSVSLGWEGWGKKVEIESLWEPNCWTM